MITAPVNQKGFSLVEALVYMAILVVVSSAAITLLLSLAGIVSEYRVNKLVSDNLITVINTVALSAQQSDSAVLSGGPDHVVLISTASTTEFYLSSGAVVMEVDGSILGNLTSDRVEITDLEFTIFDNGVTEALRVSATASSTIGDRYAADTYVTTVILRGSYD